MMRAGKDYVTKDGSEYESPRAAHLRELLKAVKPKDAPAEVEETPEAGEEPVKSANHNKPTLKLTK